MNHEKKIEKDDISDLENGLTDPEITALWEIENWREKVTRQSKTVQKTKKQIFRLTDGWNLRHFKVETKEKNTSLKW